MYAYFYDCFLLRLFTLIELEAVGLRYSTKSWLNGPIWKLAPQIQSLITWPNLMFNVEQSSSRIDCQSQVIVLVCQKLGGQLPIAQLLTGITRSTEPYRKLITCFHEFWKKIWNFLCFVFLSMYNMYMIKVFDCVQINVNANTYNPRRIFLS